MSWVCPIDRHRLDRENGALTCSQCGHRYGCSHGIPVLTRDDEGAVRVNRRIPLLEQLWEQMQHQSSDAAAEALCEQCRCARGQASPDWKFFAPLPADGRVLEIGAGLGDDTLSLSGRAASTIAIVPNLRNAMILQARFEATPPATIDLAVMPDLASLPLASGSIDTVVVAFTDHYGRLHGKRFDAEFFIDGAHADGTHACNYLLTVDMEMEPTAGYSYAGWDKGYGDFHMVPDLATLRIADWLPATAMARLPSIRRATIWALLMVGRPRLCASTSSGLSSGAADV